MRQKHAFLDLGITHWVIVGTVTIRGEMGLASLQFGQCLPSDIRQRGASCIEAEKKDKKDDARRGESHDKIRC